MLHWKFSNISFSSFSYIQILHVFPLSPSFGPQSSNAPPPLGTTLWAPGDSLQILGSQKAAESLRKVTQIVFLSEFLSTFYIFLPTFCKEPLPGSTIHSSASLLCKKLAGRVIPPGCYSHFQSNMTTQVPRLDLQRPSKWVPSLLTIFTVLRMLRFENWTAFVLSWRVAATHSLHIQSEHHDQCHRNWTRLLSISAYQLWYSGCQCQ